MNHEGTKDTKYEISAVVGLVLSDVFFVSLWLVLGG